MRGAHTRRFFRNLEIPRSRQRLGQAAGRSHAGSPHSLSRENESTIFESISDMAQSLIVELEKKIKISSLKEDKAVFSSIYARRGRGSTGTFAHPILAAAFAGYLSPKLELEVREIW